jgi:hypothetical protein
MDIFNNKSKELRSMKSVRMKLFLTVLAMVILGLCLTTAKTQAQPQVNAVLTFFDYDVIYLTDFIDVKTQKLNSSISGISLDLTVVNPPGGTVNVCVYLEVQVQLRGDSRPQTLVSGFSKNFTINGSRTLTARDFAKNGSGVAVLNDAGYYVNESLKKRITDFALTTPTTPPGTYQIKMIVLPAGSTNINAKYGGDSKNIVIPYATPDEAFVEINDPKNGSYFTNLAPTFSWTTNANTVKVSVYEAGVSQRSPQDALTGGNPYLVKEITGATSLTYPQDASRQLQENKAFVLQVEAKVITNRGEVENSSLPVVFRITDDNVGKMLDNFLSTSSGSAYGVFSTLRAEPSNWVAWQPYGIITLDGSMLTETDFQALIHDLAANHSLNLQLSVENQ